MSKPPVLLPSIAAQFVENLLAALRTAGALLVGNSALIYFGIVGRDQRIYGVVLLAGFSIFFLASIPIALIERNSVTRKAKALESEQPKGK